MHELKIDPGYFEDVIAGRKTFELRRDDRPYVVDDVLRLREFGRLPEHPVQGYTGRKCHVLVNYILRGAPSFGLMDGFCILGIVEVSAWKMDFEKVGHKGEVCEICIPFNDLVLIGEHLETNGIARILSLRGHVVGRTDEGRLDVLGVSENISETPVGRYSILPVLCCCCLYLNVEFVQDGYFDAVWSGLYLQSRRAR